MYGKVDLFEVCIEGNIEFLKCLIEVEGLNPNCRNLYGDTLICTSSKIGYLNIVKYLVESVGIIMGRLH